MSRVTLGAHAKINLNLRVLARRSDGFHDIDTVVQTITLHDTLRLEEAAGGMSLELDDPGLPAGPENLVLRAAEELSRASGGSPSRGVRAVLRKRIPAGAGLGGGSSDAAAALVGLNRLWGLGLSVGALHPIAARLGSDVPFFLSGGTARLTGRGTLVEPLPDQLGYSLVLVVPETPIATGEAYARVPAALTPAAETGRIARFRPAQSGPVEEWVRAGNDLEPGARSLCPAIGEIKDRLLTVGAGAVAMTGSGSAVFGTFAGKAAADRALVRIEGRGWRVMRADPISRGEYLRDLGLA